MTIIELVERERRGVLRLITAAGAGGALAVVAVVLAIGVILLGGARWMALPRVVPFAIWGVVAVAVGAGVWWTRWRGSREASRSGLAGAVEREQSLRTGALRGALEVASTGALGRRAADQIAAQLGAADGRPGRSLAPALRRRATRRALVAMAAGLVAVLVLHGRSSAAPDGWRAIAHPVRAWNGTLLPAIVLADLPRTVLRGERIRLTIHAPDRREITLAQRATGSAWHVARVPVTNGRAQVTLGPVDAELTLFAADGRSTSDTSVVRVVDRPFIGDVAVRALFPSYLGRREETLPLGEPARLPQGTVLAIEGQSSTELRRVALVRESDTLAFTADGRRFGGRLSALRTGRYTWSAQGVAGEIADLPAALEIEVVPDSAPRVEIVAPTRDTTIAPDDSVLVSVLAVDDHGLGSVQLRTWRKPASGARLPETVRQLATAPSAQWAGDALIDLATLKLEAGDELHIVAVGTDQSPWRQRGESRELVLRVPGLSEQREGARALADSAVARAQAAAAAEKSLQQRTAEAARARERRGTQTSGEASGTSRAGANALSYESSERAKDLAKEQRALAERVQQLQQTAKSLERQLRQTGALDSALSARLQEAQKLLRDALTPELAEQLRKLEASAQKLSAEEARSAMANLAQQQQKLREQLEKSVEMLKRAALEGAMQTLKDEARDLAKEQRALADSMERTRSDSARRATQQDARDLAQRSRDLAQQVADLQKRLEQERAESGAARANEAQRDVKESAQAMQRAAGQRSAEAQQRDREAQQRDLDARQQASRNEVARRDSAQRGQVGDSSLAARPDSTRQAASGERSAQASGQRQQGSTGAQRGAGQPQGAQGEQGERQRGGGRQNADDARQGAAAMEKAANELARAREQQINEWKSELTSELDQSIQEMLQLGREQANLEQRSREGSAADKSSLQAQQSALQQGVDKAAQRLERAGQKSSLLSNSSQRAVSDARKKVEEATREVQGARSPSDASSAMRDASSALNQAAASLVRDRERAASASSASGFAEMLQQLQEMARQQGALNAATLELVPKPGGQLDQQGRNAARALAQQQKSLSEHLDEVGDRDRTGRAEELAKEARQIAQAMESGIVDQSVADRQQRLFRRMLDAGRTLEQDQRDDTGKRESRPGTGFESFAPANANASGKGAQKFQPPTWNELRGLTPEERRIVLEYFKRINAAQP